MADIPAAHAVEIAGGHAVERDGDRPDVEAREHQREEAAELVGLHGVVAQHGRALLEGGDRDLP